MEEEGVAPFVLSRVGLLHQQLCLQPVLQLLLLLLGLVVWIGSREEAPPLFYISDLKKFLLNFIKSRFSVFGVDAEQS